MSNTIQQDQIVFTCEIIFEKAKAFDHSNENSLKYLDTPWSSRDCSSNAGLSKLEVQLIATIISISVN